MVKKRIALMQNNQKIPEGWSVKKLGELGSFSKGSGITKNDLVSEGIPCVRYAELYTKYNFVISNCISFVSEEVSKTAKPIKYGDILFAGSGETKEEIGKCAAYISRISAYAGGDNIILRPFQDNSIFLSYFLNTVGRRYLNRLGQGDSIVHIHAENLKKVYIPIPPLPEQEKIAGILGTWDEAIEKLSNLIEQKKLLKKGLMQKILTGKTRLKGFPQPWKEVKLGNLCTMFSGGTPSVLEEDYYKNGDIPFIRSGEISSSETALFITEKGLKNSSAKMIEKGDLLYALYGATSGETAISKINGAINQAILCIRSTKIEILYLYYVLLNNKSIILSKYLQGGQGNLSADIVKKLSIKMPSDISEQQAIADVLSTADEEIDLLNKKLEALKEQKKGLMQQLLTGQIRVKVN